MQTTQPNGNTYTGTYTGIVTEKLAESKAFYVDLLGFNILFENENYIQLQAAEGSAPEIGLMRLTPDNNPDNLWEVYPGQGIFYVLMVEDVDTLYEQLPTDKLNLIHAPKDEEWGERHFMFRDPNGLIMSISQAIEPSEAFKQAYMV